VPVWGSNRGRQNCDGSRAHNADRLLIRPASGRQAGTGLSARTNHWKDTTTTGHSTMESRTKSTDTNLTNAPDGTTHTLTVRKFVRRPEAPVCSEIVLRTPHGESSRFTAAAADFEYARTLNPAQLEDCDHLPRRLIEFFL
jgi:hypothetical protein